MHACSKENQPYPSGMEECCQQARGGVPSPLLSPGDTHLEYWVWAPQYQRDKDLLEILFDI